ncbi:MAG: flagellar hook-length control protein FliK [Deltaproteobacteria bacterium]|nr:flagellar hook-length control protein FliK [Deltaproteobacteria bacterium]
MQTLAIIMPDNNMELTKNVKVEKDDQPNLPTPLQPVEISDDDKNGFLSTLAGIIDEQILFRPWNTNILNNNESNTNNSDTGLDANGSEPLSNKNGLMYMTDNCIEGYSFFINGDKALTGSLGQGFQLWMKPDNISGHLEFYKTVHELQMITPKTDNCLINNGNKHIPLETPPEQPQNRILSENYLLQELSSEPDKLQFKKAALASKGDFISTDTPLKGSIKEQALEGVQIDTIKDSALDEKSGRLKKGSQNKPGAISNNKFFNKSSFENKIEAIETDKKENTLLFSNIGSPGKISQNVINLKSPEHNPKSIESQVLSQITEKAVISIKNGKQEIKIRLKPDSLGLLRIDIKTENNRVMLKIFTETPTVKEVIQSNISHLNNAFSNHGLEIDKLEVFIGLDPGQSEGNLNKKEFFQTSNRHNESEEQDDELSFETDKTTRSKGSKRETGLVDFFA